jgi:hypothetical protein
MDFPPDRRMESASGVVNLIYPGAAALALSVLTWASV